MTPTGLYTIEPAGIYIHIPFCIRKCPYCDFYSVTDLSLQDEFIRALMREISMNRRPGMKFDTVYMGGGTPSVLEPGVIGHLLESVHRLYDVTDDAEISLEVNPGTVDQNQLEQFRGAGINRLTIGVQSFQDANLNFLGRIHSAEIAKGVIRQARNAGFENIGLDLIYGLPDQSISTWLSDLDTAMEFEPEHMSCYMLTYESGTPMDQARKQGRFHPLKEQPGSRLFEITMETLGAYGYTHYEISNYARRDHLTSRHNSKYWSFAPYIGFGPSAHSYIHPRRYWNHRSMERYLADLSHGRKPVADEEILSTEQQMMEMLYLSLRTADGIDTTSFDSRFGVSFSQLFGDVIEHLVQMEYMDGNSSRWRLTRKGMLFSDSIAAMFM